MLSTKKTKKETRDLKALLNDSHRWRMQHTKVVRDLVRLHHKNHLQVRTNPFLFSHPSNFFTLFNDIPMLRDSSDLLTLFPELSAYI